MPSACWWSAASRTFAAPLSNLAHDRSVDAIGLNAGAIHALWTLHGLGALDGSDAKATAAAVAALKHKSPGVRRNAVQVLPRSEDSLRAIVAAGLLKDTDLQVRLAALLALADMPPSPDTPDALLASLDPVLLQDRWLTDALTCAAARDAGHFLPALARGPTDTVARQPCRGRGAHRGAPGPWSRRQGH